MLKFDNFLYNGFEITNYNSIDLSEVREYIDSINPEWLFKIKVAEGMTIEKICLDYYGNTKYADFILFLNGREGIFDMPKLYDIVKDISDRRLEQYFYKVYGDSLYPQKENMDLPLLDDETGYSHKLDDENLKNSYLTLVIPTMISHVNTQVKQILNTQLDMYNLLDMELEENAE